jgi:hypothetical protein
VRGGLDDALEKLARRDELRRRAAGEATGTPTAVTELVEAIAAVVARNPKLGVTVGVEGAGEPILLHFFFEEGQVQVNADNAVTARAEPATTARHADVDVEVGDPIEDAPYQPPPAYVEPDRSSHDDQDRFGPSTYGYAEPSTPTDEAYYAESATAERRYGAFDNLPPGGDPRYPARDPGEDSRDLGARMRNLGMASREKVYPPHPFAATPPPPVPPQTSEPQQQTRRIHPEQHRAPAEPSAAERFPAPRPAAPHPAATHSAAPHPTAPRPAAPRPAASAPQAVPHQAVPRQPAQHQAAEQRGGVMPPPLAKPIPLQVERPEQTEQAARRLAALLRDDPSLLNQAPPD